MPIFEYRCDLGHLTEKFFKQNDTAAHTAICDVCTSEGRMELADKVLSATKTLFKHFDTKAIK